MRMQSLQSTTSVTKQCAIFGTDGHGRKKQIISGKLEKDRSSDRGGDRTSMVDAIRNGPAPILRTVLSPVAQGNPPHLPVTRHQQTRSRGLRQHSNHAGRALTLW
mmetsp:Transcript_41266/g.110299  ORF Transcript_41266/g.110299 Transcript_41266/m.110299 type:complete len:105 (-) Transcript_41266:133-447(-)